MVGKWCIFETCVCECVYTHSWKSDFTFFFCLQPPPSYIRTRIHTHTHRSLTKNKEEEKNRILDWFRPTSKNYELKHKSEIFILLKRNSRLNLLLPFIFNCDSLYRSSLLFRSFVRSFFFGPVFFRFVSFRLSQRLFFSLSAYLNRFATASLKNGICETKNLIYRANLFFFSTIPFLSTCVRFVRFFIIFFWMFSLLH